MAKTFNNLYPQLCAVDNVLSAARAAMQGKLGGTSAARFHARWETHAVQLAQELAAGIWQPGNYTYFHIHEPKLRRVAAAPFRDRVVHHALVRVLEPIFEKRFIEDSYACRKGKGTHAGVRRCGKFARRFPYVLKCDIRRYFPSIDHATLLQRIGRTIADRQVMALIRQILDTHEDGRRMEWGEDLLDSRVLRHGLPIGNLTSQFFANIHLDGLDHYVKQELGVKGYVRYVDDFLIFAESREQARAWGREVRNYLSAMRLEIHPDKYRLVRTDREGADFCGFVCFSNGRIKLRGSSVRRYAARYKKLCQHGELEDIRASVRSWIGHVQHAHSWRLRAAVLGRSIRLRRPA
jgi:retron-type reverse transcriptase